MPADQCGTSRAPERADNGQFPTRSPEIYLPQRPTQKFLTGRNCSASSTRNKSGGNSDALDAAVIGKDSSVRSRMRCERQFEEPSSNMTSSTLLCEIKARINDQLVFMGDDIACDYV
ncbi:hypothetical protein T07_13615 [Trichinella nelsoni]|uniref:Uncharacterized protein n=1 Tax=Trichinella nelsoni TaxID=6336 RepID=A0A0V0RFK3_9BILA|nr:hypothetical protein T07_13615 [Trichinella nelsoni]